MATSTDPWTREPLPTIRRETLAGGRIVRCFAERPRSLFGLFERAARARPDHDAVVCGDRRWRYREAAGEIERIAAGLAALGLERGDRIAMLVGNRPEFVFVLFAAQRLGLITVPIGVREQRPGLAYMLAQCTARAIVFDEKLIERVPDATEVPSLRWRIAIEPTLADTTSGSTATPAPGTTSAPDRSPSADLSSSPDASSSTGRSPPPGRARDVSLATVRAAGLDRSAPIAEVDEQDTAVILYTSGTTGKPKGARLTHLNVAHSVLHFEACMRLVPDDRSALAVPASHVTGLIATIASMAHVGGATVVLPEFKAAEFVALVERERITHTLMVPAMYNLCLLVPDVGARDLGSWRIGGYGGAPMPVSTIDALAERLPGLVLVNAYGATETTSPTTMMPSGLTRDHADTVGVALPCAEIVVMDDDGREVPPGQVGELWIGGPMVVPGYWDNPEATASSFTAGFWHSGDLGSVDAEGFVRIFDRKKDMLNRGGFKIYSVEVENALMAFPGVVEAAIVARPCPVLGERVHAVVHAPGMTADDEALRAHCRKLLADYKVPETVTWSSTPLPRNANGKVLKRLLREP
jgi:O-succinylbenzoic acid--CoA ligase